MMNLVQLGRMPWFAVHVGILFQVVTDFVRLLLTFLTVLIAFTLGFCILLNEVRIEMKVYCVHKCMITIFLTES